MRLIYTIGIAIYVFAIRIAAILQPKAKKWVDGRKNWKADVKAEIKKNNQWLWFHCASLGEFEQARPLIEKIKGEYPAKKILLTFFSPSGYEIRKNYSLADKVMYLPADFTGNARYFFDAYKPEAGFFIRYDIWVNFILEAGKRKIPLFLISAKLSPKSAFTHSFLSPLFRQAFNTFAWIFCQDENSLNELKVFTGKTNLSVSGDTRADRVVMIADAAEDVPGIKEFVADRFCVIAGSAWEAEEKMILALTKELQEKEIAWIIAPHEIHPDNISNLIANDAENQVAFSALSSSPKNKNILWIDNVGMLNKIYKYGSVAFIGGGFGKGIHNILEPAAFGLPVAFGPNHIKFKEAGEMILTGGGMEIRTSNDLRKFILQYFENKELLKIYSMKAGEYVQKNSGATENVMQGLRGINLFSQR